MPFVGVEAGVAASGRVAAVVFDLDGTLLDSMASAPKAYVDTVCSLGGPALSVGDVVAAWHAGPMPVVLAHFLGRAVSADDVECFYGCFAAATATVGPFRGVPEMIDRLDGAGYRLGVFTAATRRAANLVLAAAGLAARLPVTVCGDEISRPKPDPQGLRRAGRLMGVGMTETAYVGDAEVDLRCAAAAGALGIHARWGDPAAVITGARLVARHPDDVVRLLRDGDAVTADPR